MGRDGRAAMRETPSFEFLNELAESRIFQYRDDFRNKSARELADITFVMTLVLEVLRHRQRRSSQEYAGRTIYMSDFKAVKSSATDLANLVTVLSDQEKFDREIKADSRVSVPELQLKRYLRDVADGKESGSFDREFLLKFEDYLRVNDGELRNARRIVAYWNTASAMDKKNTVDTLMRTLRSKANRIDLYLLAQPVL